MAGRPTLYTPELLEKAKTYLAALPEDEVIHSIEGLSDYLNIARSTVYDWATKKNEDGTLVYPEFSDILETVLQKQGKTLINKGLEGKFNSTISKLILTKHNYSDKQELTGKDGEKLEMGVVVLPAKNGADENTLATAA